ncbi:tetratricopeptide repeat protein [Sulfurospirillum sp. MES]|uniref:tetratricopeptide repeat protein n=1 Tax=Sulfurospirillum sp. MES TaxID=1565314 RepID=UPI0005428E1A|nr:tetratricopeptide repeat protein [Sulfurospirillum sp. MES]KHG33012.1 MAG: hypothetical protein OA34_12115 [Sulfurospirillum sp. MES]
MKISLCLFLMLLFQQLYAGEVYEKGMSALRSGDYQTGVQLIEQSAQEGDKEGQFTFACLLETMNRYDLAIPWYEKAIAQGHVEAHITLAVLYYAGLGTAKNYEKAYSLVKKGTDLGSKNGYTLLGMILFHGYGIPKDTKKGLYYYELAIQANDKDESALSDLGIIYTTGKENVKKDIKKGIMYLEKAASLGSINAQLELGFDYYQGAIVPKDWKKAYVYWAQAAKKGNSTAKENLASLCRQSPASCQ